MANKMNLKIKLISCLLHYPDESLLQLLPDFRDVVNNLEDISEQNNYNQMITYFETTPLLQLQEQYTETFDLNSSNCLNLTYHRWGDTEKRGPALVHLEDTYLKAGFQRIDSELPDYLPLVLEFIAERPDAARAEIIPLYGEVVKALAGRLRASEHPYAPLLEQLVTIFGLSEVDPDSQAKAIQ